MGEGRQRENWRHTSTLIAALVNCAPFRQGDPVSPAEFDPFAPKAPLLTVPMSAVKAMFMRGAAAPAPDPRADAQGG